MKICFVLKEPIFNDTFYVVFSVRDIQCQIFLNGVMTQDYFYVTLSLKCQANHLFSIWLIFRK